MDWIDKDGQCDLFGWVNASVMMRWDYESILCCDIYIHINCRGAMICRQNEVVSELCMLLITVGIRRVIRQQLDLKVLMLTH